MTYMKTAAKILISSALLLGCDRQETNTSCDPGDGSTQLSQQGLDLFKPPLPNFSNVILVLCGDNSQKMTWFSGTVVGHNSVLTAASCLNGGVESIFVVPNIRAPIDVKAPDLQNKIISMSINPKKVISHATISTSASTVESSKRADDVAVLVFNDQVFETVSYKKSLIGSLYDGYPRRSTGQQVRTIGYGDEMSPSIILTSKRSVFIRDEAASKDLVFSHYQKDVTTDSSQQSSMYDKNFAGDKGGPLLAPLKGRAGDSLLDFQVTNILGVLVHIEPSDAPSSSTVDTKDPSSKQKSTYVDLYSERSLSLLRKSMADGANFLSPSELKYPSYHNWKNKSKNADCRPKAKI